MSTLSMSQLCLHLSEDGADADRLEQLAGYLRTELLDLDVGGVTKLPVGKPPPGTRGFDVAAVGALLVSLGQTATVLRAVVVGVQNWCVRGHRSLTVRLELDGDVLELSGASAADQRQLVELFVSRHTLGQEVSWTSHERL